MARVDWGIDASNVVTAESLISPILTAHPMWLAMLGEVILRRRDLGLHTHVVDYTADESLRSTWLMNKSKPNPVLRLIRRDPIAQFKKSLKRAGAEKMVVWIKHPTIEGDIRRIYGDTENLRLLRLNVVSESLSLVATNNAFEVLTEAMVTDMSRTWVRTFFSLSQVLNDMNFDAAIIFNGRFVKEGSARAACLAHGIEVYGFDQGNRPGTISIARNHIHEHRAYVDAVEECWSGNDSSFARAFSEQWLIERTNCQGGGGNSYSLGFKPLSEEFCPPSPLFVAFTTSSHELISIDTDSGATPQDQRQWIEELLDFAMTRQDISLAIRAHPTSIDTNPHIQYGWEKYLDNLPKNVKLFGGDSRVNSYELIRRADVVLTFGSSITMEAAFIGKPVVELCETHFSRLSICRSARTMKQLDALVSERNWVGEAHARDQALKYAFWLTWGGESLKYAVVSDPFAALAGTPLQPFRFTFHCVHGVYAKVLAWRSSRRITPLEISFRNNSQKGDHPYELVNRYLDSVLNDRISS